MKKLGAGGMGEVYEAQDTRLGRRVALKVLSPAVASDSEARARLEREARAVAALNHPNIVSLFALEEDGPVRFLTMELVEGTTLADRLASAGQLPEGEILDIAVQVTDALAEAHRLRLIHRDIKPSNVMVDRRGRVKILDFGLARLVEAGHLARDDAPTLPLKAVDAIGAPLTEAGVLVGTVAYMSPEQLRGEPLDHRSDLFSFGVVVYEMLAGRRPFTGDSPASVAAAILAGSPERPIVSGDQAAALVAIAMRCLERERSSRYQETFDLCRDLAILRDSSPGRHAATRSTSVPRRPRHRRVTFSGHDFDPAISSDGKFLAFVRRDAGGAMLMVHDRTSGSAVPVYRGRHCRAPKWSPDGAELLATVGDAAIVVPRLGGPPRTFPDISFATWSNDGAAVIGGRTSSTQELAIVARASGRRSALPLPSDAVVLLGVAASPRSEHVAVLTCEKEDRHVLTLLAPRGGIAGRVCWEAAVTALQFSGAGDSIYCVVDGEATRELQRVALDQRMMPAVPPMVVMTGIEIGPKFGISREGSLAYTRTQVSVNLWSVPIDGSGAPRALTQGTAVHGAPSISPDGRSVAFCLGGQIHIMSVAGEEPAPVTFAPGVGCASPAWSPDGRRIAFFSTVAGRTCVATLDLANQEVRTFASTDAGVSVRDIAWSPSGEILYQWPGCRGFGVLDPATEEERPLVDAPLSGTMFHAVPSSDGRKVAVEWQRPDGDGVFILEQGRPPERLHVAQEKLVPLAFHERDRALFVFARRTRTILSVGEGGQATEVASIPLENLGGIALSPDLRTIVCQVFDVRSDVWTCDDFEG